MALAAMHENMYSISELAFGAIDEPEYLEIIKNIKCIRKKNNQYAIHEFMKKNYFKAESIFIKVNIYTNK